MSIGTPLQSASTQYFLRLNFYIVSVHQALWYYLYCTGRLCFASRIYLTIEMVVCIHLIFLDRRNPFCPNKILTYVALVTEHVSIATYIGKNLFLSFILITIFLAKKSYTLPGCLAAWLHFTTNLRNCCNWTCVMLCSANKDA